MGDNRNQRLSFSVGMTAQAFTVGLLMSWVLPTSIWSQEIEDSFQVRWLKRRQTDAVLGQQISLSLQVLSLQPTGPLYFDVPEMNGGLFFQTADIAVNSTEQIDGKSYISRTYSFACYAQVSGTCKTPIVTVRSEIDEQPVAARAPSLALTIRQPSGTESFGWFLSSSDFKIVENWSSDSTELKVGDAIERSVLMTASDVHSLAFPAPEFPTQDGVSLQRGQPDLEDRLNRGTLAARRSDTATYYFEQAGSIVIPAVRFTWWNLDRSRLETTVLPGKTFEVAPANPAPETAEFTEPPSADIPTWVWWAIPLTLVAIGVAGVKLEPKFHAWLHAYQSNPRTQERRAFSRLASACEQNSATETVNRLQTWWYWTRPHGAPLSLGQIAASHEQEFAQEIQQVQEASLSNDTTWNGQRLLRELRRKRRTQQKHSIASRRASTALPPLNPNRNL